MPLQNNTYSNAACDPIINPEDAIESMIDVTLKASTTFVAGTVVGRITTGGKFAAYASGSSDGSQVPVGILRRAATTDSSSNITNADEWGSVGIVAAVFTQGTFLVADLTGLDDNAVAVLNGHLDAVNVAAAKIFTF